MKERAKKKKKMPKPQIAGWKALYWWGFLLRVGVWERDSACLQGPHLALRRPRRRGKNYISHEALGAERPRVLPGKTDVREDRSEALRMAAQRGGLLTGVPVRVRMDCVRPFLT